MWLFEKVLNRLVKRGRLSLVYADGRTRTFGTADPDFPDLTLRLHDKRVPFDIVKDPRLGLAEAYIDGRATIEGGDIMEFIAFMRANTPWERGQDLDAASPLSQAMKSAGRRLVKLNDRRSAKANVAHHYDLSGALYSLFLDVDRQYSCAYWPDKDNAAGISLEQSQVDKKAHIAAKLALEPGMKVLDIGCGWGGMALYLHQTCGVDVLGVTLSEEQLKVARQRAIDAGVTDHVRFELIDYRDVGPELGAPFDRIVSVGMFEHVGTRHYDEFFRKCHNLLTPEGVMLIHTIGRQKPGTTDAFTRKYIFPGGYIPALSEMVAGSEPNRLMISDVEVLRLHYALTLREWYKRTQEKKAEIVALYDERFHRLWSFYLAGATAAFEYGSMVNFQVQYVRNRRTLPITRDYMMETEAKLRTRA
ncbi:MAG: SAM-dependent methyltransferase [Sphingobium sp.]|nr:MAG: SAM-dependent methyltransferase [Sphingobium sp.]